MPTMTELEPDNDEQYYHSVYDEESDQPPVKNKESSASELKKAEEGSSSTQSSAAETSEKKLVNQEQEDDGNFTYKQTPTKKKGSGKLSGKSLILLGSAGGGVLILALILLSTLSSAKIIHLAENVTVWNMARTARTFRSASTQNMASSIESAALTESGFAAMSKRWNESSVKSTLDRYNNLRPKKVYQEVNSKITPVFEEGPPRRFLPGNRQVFKGWELPNGALLEPTDTKWYKPIQGYKEKLRFAAELESTLETELKGTNSLVRGKVMRQILSERGVKLYWWEKRGSTYQGIKQQYAEYLESKKAFERSTKPDYSNCASADTCTDAKRVEEEIKKKVDDKGSETLNAEQLKEEAATVFDEEVSKPTSAFKTVTGAVSTVYAVALPLCLVFDGSIENSSKTTDVKESSLISNYMMVRSAADQQKAGATTVEAVGGLNGKLGDISDSVPLRRASGENIDPSNEINAAALPQATATGNFSLFNVALGGFIPPNIIQSFTDNASSVCQVVTDVRVGVAFGVIEVALTVLGGGTPGALKTAAGGGVKELGEFLAKQTVGKLERVVGEAGSRRAAAKVISKQVASAGGSFFKKILRDGVLILGATELAKMLVLNYSNAQNNGLETDETIANQVDMGGNLYAQQNNQKLLYGRPMTQPEVLSSNMSDLAYIQEKNSQLPFSEKYLAITNPNSLIARSATTLSSTLNTKGAFDKMFSSILTSLKSVPGNIFVNILNKSKVRAASVSGAGEYNIVQWGWSNDEESIIQNNADYFPIENELILEASGKYEEIEGKYSKCYSSTMGTLLSSGDIQREQDGQVNTAAGDCSPQNLGINNPQYNDLVFRWRLAKRNTSVQNQLIDIQNGPQSSTTEQPQTAAVAGAAVTAGDTSNLTCTAGTDAGVVDGYQNGQLFKIRVCSVQNMGQVNAQIAKNVDDLLNAARADGVNLSGSSFRSMDSQIDLRRKHCGDSQNDIYQKPSDQCSPPTARPGYSNHQMGLALDFGSCGNASTACYKWLKNNAQNFGLKNLPSETWHWSVDGR